MRNYCATLVAWNACCQAFTIQPTFQAPGKSLFSINWHKARDNNKPRNDHVGFNSVQKRFCSVSNTNGEGSDITDIKAFESDVTKVLKEIRVGSNDATLYPQGIAQSKSRMSISYVWDLQMWKKHTARPRYIRHLFCIFSSRLLRRILPQLASFVSWAAIYVFLISKRLNGVKENIVPLASLSLVSTFVGFLLTLRSNQGLARLGEGRELWGRAFIVTRDTAQLLAAYVYPKDNKLGLSAARHLAMFPWLLKGKLRDTDDTDIIDTMLPSNLECAYLKCQRKKPAACIARIRQTVANLAASDDVPVASHQQLERNLNEMNYILGMCERLRGSPIPPLYTSHTSRLLVFYLFFLPIALHGAHVKNTINVLVTATVAYAMLGLDEISHLLEQPFQLMPLHQLSKNMMLDVADAFVCQPPSVKSSRHIIEKEAFDTKPGYW